QLKETQLAILGAQLRSHSLDSEIKDLEIKQLKQQQKDMQDEAAKRSSIYKTVFGNEPGGISPGAPPSQSSMAAIPTTHSFQLQGDHGITNPNPYQITSGGVEQAPMPIPDESSTETDETSLEEP